VGTPRAVAPAAPLLVDDSVVSVVEESSVPKCSVPCVGGAVAGVAVDELGLVSALETVRRRNIRRRLRNG